MAEVPVVSGGPGYSCRSFAGTEWEGAEHVIHYLHLSASPCEKCHGPVVAGWLGTRHGQISKETRIREIGAACLACGFRPEVMVEPLVGHRFGPVEWKWVIREQPVDPNGDALAAELSQDADTVGINMRSQSRVSCPSNS
jgi:hypothetical protein